MGIDGEPSCPDNALLHFLQSGSCLLDQNLYILHACSVLGIMDKLCHILGFSSLSSNARLAPHFAILEKGRRKWPNAG